jgi:hypothetical protein
MHADSLSYIYIYIYIYICIKHQKHEQTLCRIYIYIYRCIKHKKHEYATHAPLHIQIPRAYTHIRIHIPKEQPLHTHTHTHIHIPKEQPRHIYTYTYLKHEAVLTLAFSLSPVRPRARISMALCSLASIPAHMIPCQSDWSFLCFCIHVCTDCVGITFR